MRYHQILFEMTVPQAAAVFKRHGVDPTNVKDLKQAWLRLVKSNHPDAGGDTTTMQMINAAYDVLKQSDDKQSDDDDQHSSTPVWAWAGHAGGIPPSGHISREDYRDVNYIKKRMWELSDHSREEWSITGFDGAYLRASTTVFGSPNIFAAMAEAMVMWQTKGGNSYPCRAVIVNKRKTRDEAYLIWADGVSYARDPIAIQYDRNLNPENYKSLEGRLRNLIDEMRDNGGRIHDQPEMGDMGGGEQQRHTFDTGSYVYHPKYGVGRIIHPAIKKGMARVAFIDKTGNVRASLLRRATKAEERQFTAANRSS